ncbi:MAG: Gfo/Idh/MocA family oxidoreductase [Ignavibacteria bacterium]|jgi:predicted dehydrogenase|nr:Gfo/Idh/MocA family oxidoreductase [Ignavibacteria bacterium]MCU7502912.1 Gfo/Idh/MocA family oxidoreductase [Ignavibacteria bacterium]MCU7515594.1 Gfo/Idh/MocA family oxidoreductase [Ignavibacteria bacterium]
MLNGAFIGFGKIARTGHMPAYLRPDIRSKAKITAVCDMDESLREVVNAEFPGIKFYNDVDLMLEEEAIDFVDVCLPPSFHRLAVEKALTNNKHILCEKPLAQNVSDSKRIELMIKNSSLAFSICHQYKYSPIWMKFKDFTECHNGNGGIFIQFNVYRTGADNGYFRSNPGWRTDRKVSGGGILSDTGVHYLYLASWLMGAPVKVTTVNKNLGNSYLNVEDSSFVLLEYEKGIVELNLTWASDHRENLARISSGSSSLVYNGKCLTRYDADKVQNIEVPDASDKSSYIVLYERLLVDFFEKILAGKENYQSITEAYETIRLLDACYTSALESRTVIL